MRLREREYLPDVVEYLFAKILRRFWWVIIFGNHLLCSILLMFDRHDDDY
jgi:hypothetical protein